MRPLHVVVLAVSVLLAACGTHGVDVAGPTEVVDPAVAVVPAPTSSPATTLPSATLPSTTTIAPVPSSTTSPPPTITPTTTSVPGIRIDSSGVPVNGQTSGVVRTSDGWLLPVFETLESGWRVWTPCGRETGIVAGEFIGSVDFVLDPGHGGSEPGAVGPGGTREADVNLQVTRRIAAALEADGYRVAMTRERDVRVPIVTRAEIALALDPIAFISVHHNAGTEMLSDEPGTEMFYQLASADSKRLAGLIYEETRRALDPMGSSWFALNDAGAMGRPNRSGADYYGVLRRPAAVTSVLAEFAYITNATEEDLLNRADVQDALAGAVRAAVERFTSSEDPGSGFTDDPIFRGYGPSGAGRTTNCTDPALPG